MADETTPKDSEKFEIQAYKRPQNINDLIKTHVPFSGAPQRHPYEPDKVILIPDPFSTHTFYYEFEAGAISYVEELPSLVLLDIWLPGIDGIETLKIIQQMRDEAHRFGITHHRNKRAQVSKKMPRTSNQGFVLISFLIMATFALHLLLLSMHHSILQQKTFNHLYKYTLNLSIAEAALKAGIASLKRAPPSQAPTPQSGIYVAHSVPTQVAGMDGKSYQGLYAIAYLWQAQRDEQKADYYRIRASHQNEQPVLEAIISVRQDGTHSVQLENVRERLTFFGSSSNPWLEETKK